MADREQTLLFIVDVRVNNARALQALGRDMRQELGARQERLVALGQAADEAAAGHQSLADAITQSNLAAARPITTPASSSSDVSFAGARGRRDIGSKTDPLVVAQESGQAAGLGSMAAAVGDKATSSQAQTTPVAPAVTTGIPSSTDRQFLDRAVTQVAQKALKPEDDRILSAMQTEKQLSRNIGGRPLGQELVDTLAAVRQSRMPPGVYATRPTVNPERYAYSGQHGGYVELPRKLTAAETAGRMGISTAAARDLAAQGGIPGAQKVAGQWVIPEDVVTRIIAEGGAGGNRGGGVPPTARGGYPGSFGEGPGGRPGGSRTLLTLTRGLRTEGDNGVNALGFRNLFFGDQGRGGMFGLPGFGSIGSLGGLGLEHWLLTAMGLTASAGSAIAGAGLLGTAGLTTAAIGGGADALVNHATITETETLVKNQQALNQAVAVYGRNSLQAKQAQNQLNYSIEQLGGGQASQAIQGLATDVQNLRTQFLQASNGARAISANILDQAVQLGSDFTPMVTQAAQRNLAIVNTGLKPLFAWLEGPQGIGIFNTLENKFASDLPTSIHMLDMALEDFLRLMQATVPYTGGFTKTLNNFFTNKNRESAGQYRNEVQKLVGDFTEWKNLVKILGQDLVVLFHADAGTANSIVGELTHMLDKLHTWETSVHGQMQLQTIFAVHKQQIDELLKLLPTLMKGYGSFYLDAAPAIVTAITDIAKAINFLVSAVEKVPGGGELVGLLIVLNKLGALGPALRVVGPAMAAIATGEKDMGAASALVGGAKAAAPGTAVRGAEGSAGTAEAAGAGVAGGSVVAKILGALSKTGLGTAARGAVVEGATGAGMAAEGAGLSSLADAIGAGGAALAPVVAAVVPLAAVAIGAYGGYRFLKTAFGNTPSTNTTTDTSGQLAQALRQGANQVPGQSFPGLRLTPSAQRYFSQFAPANASVSVSGLGDTKQAQTDLVQFENTMRSSTSVAKLSASQLEGMIKEGNGLAKVFPQFADQIDKFVKQAQTDLQPIQGAMRTMTARWDADGKSGLAKLVDVFTQNIALIDNTVGGFQGQRLIADDVNKMVDELTAGMKSGRISVAQGMTEVNAALQAGLTNGAITWEDKWQTMFQVVNELYKSGKISAGQYQTDMHQIMLGGLSKLDNDSRSAISKMNAHLKQLFSEGNDGIVVTRAELNAQLKTKDAQMNAQAGQDMITYAATLLAGTKGAGAAATGGINAILATLNKALRELGQSPVSQVQLQAATGQGQLNAKIQGETTHPGVSAPSGNAFTNPFTKGLATGGMMVNQPMFIVGEEAPAHPEYVIPTNPAYRPRAIDLWMSAAHDIGIPGFAAGGIAAPRVRGGGGFGAEVHGALGLVASAASHMLGAKQAMFGGRGSRVSGAGLSGSLVQIVRQIASREGWGEAQVQAWLEVINRESGGSMTAQNPSSGAYGIAQFINGPGEYAQYGGNVSSMSGQLTAMANYIHGRYGNPAGAWAHELSAGWYARGGVLAGRGVRGLAGGGTVTGYGGTPAYHGTTYVQLPANLPNYTGTTTTYVHLPPNFATNYAHTTRIPQSAFGVGSLLYQLQHPTGQLQLSGANLAAALHHFLEGISEPKVIAEAEHYATTTARAMPMAPRLAKVALGVAVQKLTSDMSGLSDSDVLDVARKYADSKMAIGPKLANAALAVAVTKTTNAIASLQTSQGNTASLAGALQGLPAGTTLASLGLTGRALTASGLTAGQAHALIGGSPASYGVLAGIYGGQAGQLKGEQAHLEAEYKQAVKQHNKKLQASLTTQLQGVDTALATAISNGQQALQQETQAQITDIQTRVGNLTNFQGVTSSLATALQGLPAGTPLSVLGNLGAITASTAGMLSAGTIGQLVGGGPGSYGALAGVYQGQAGALQAQQSQLMGELAAVNQSGNSDLATAIVTELQTVDSDLVGALSSAQQAIVQGIQAQGQAFDQIAQGFGTGQGILSSITNLAPGTNLSDLGITPAIAAALGLPSNYGSLEGTGISFLQNLQQTQGGVLTPAQLAAAGTGTNALNTGLGTEMGGFENELYYDEGQLPNLSGTDLTSMQSTIYGLISTIVGLKGSIQQNNDSLTQLTQSVNGNTNAVTNNTGAMTGQVSFTFQGQQYLASDTVVGLGVGG